MNPQAHYTNKNGAPLFTEIATGFWTPTVNPWQPLKKSPNTSLTVACLTGDRLYHGMRFECRVLLLTRDNWRDVLECGKPDLLLIESVNPDFVHGWNLSRNDLRTKTVLDYALAAKKLGIPSALWITGGHDPSVSFESAARCFDFIFCADPRMSDSLRIAGISSGYLPPCVQPALYNPFRTHEDRNGPGLGVLYDGLADFGVLGKEIGVLEAALPFGLSLIESRNERLIEWLDIPPAFRRAVLGRVKPTGRSLALKYAKTCLSLKGGRRDATEQAWSLLEAVASRLPVLHHGRIGEDSVLKGLVLECPNPDTLRDELAHMNAEDLYRESQAHVRWRKAALEHTLAHRFRDICRTAGLPQHWKEFPRASLITPTYRRDNLTACLKTYECQTYPDKELIIVFNGNELPSWSELGLDGTRKDIHLAHVPNELFAGACLNQGEVLASGEYCFRIDDDDIYGPNYILDMLLMNRAIDADLFGKAQRFILYRDDGVYSRSFKASPLTCFGSSHFGTIWFAGHSVSGRKDLFSQFKYPDIVYGAADSIFQKSLTELNLTCAVMDIFNILAVRDEDTSQHTWKDAKSDLNLLKTDLSSDALII